MLIYPEDYPAKFHHDLFWKDQALGCFEERCPNNNNNRKKTKMSSNMGSVPDPKSESKYLLVVEAAAVLTDIYSINSIISITSYLTTNLVVYFVHLASLSCLFPG